MRSRRPHSHRISRGPNTFPTPTQEREILHSETHQFLQSSTRVQRPRRPYDEWLPPTVAKLYVYGYP